MNLGSDPGEDEVHEISVTPSTDADQAAAAPGQEWHGWFLQGGAGDSKENRRALIAAEDRAHLRRLAISAVVVLLVHGAIVAAVITWRKTMVAPAGLPRSIMIELAPVPSAPATQQTELPPAPERHDTPIEKVEEKTEEKTAARGEEEMEPKSVEQPPGAVAPVTPVPSENAEGERAVDVERVTGGGAPGAVPAHGSGDNPIDTRIAEPHGPHSKSATKAGDWKKTIMARPSKNSGERQPPRDPSAAGGMARNAIGTLMQNRAAAASAKGLSATDGAKNAVGGPVMNILAGTASNAVNGTVTNAIGVTVPIRASATGPNGQVASVVTTLADAAINGTTMTRRGTGPGVVGGPAKNAAGVINGTLIKPRHP